jgi:hypothetical protein
MRAQIGMRPYKHFKVVRSAAEVVVLDANKFQVFQDSLGHEPDNTSIPQSAQIMQEYLLVLILLLCWVGVIEAQDELAVVATSAILRRKPHEGEIESSTADRAEVKKLRTCIHC